MQKFHSIAKSGLTRADIGVFQQPTTNKLAFQKAN